MKFVVVIRPANPDQCQEINDELNVILSGSEELNFTQSYVPFFVQITNAKYVTYIENQVSEELVQVVVELTKTKFI